MTPHDRLKLRIREAGIPYSDVSTALGVSNSALSLWLSGKRKMPAGLEDRIEAVLERLAPLRSAYISAKQEFRGVDK